MGLLSTTREMSGPTKIKRGLGLLLVAVVGWAVLAAFVAGTHDTAFGFTTAATLLTLAVSFAVVGCLVAGLVLLLWGLLRN